MRKKSFFSRINFYSGETDKNIFNFRVEPIFFTTLQIEI